MPYPPRVKIVEVSPRDGLQNELVFVPTELKIRFIKKLVETGASLIEATSFVHPKSIPQMKDAEEVMRQCRGIEGLTCLVPNLTGLTRAMNFGMREISVFTATSETFNEKNINTSIEESLKSIESVITEAKKYHLRIRGYVSTVFGCPYEGETSVDTLKTILEKFFQWGVYECSLGDTTGMAHPVYVESLLGGLGGDFDLSKMAMHFHDTRGLALANIVVSLQSGITVFDSSAGGLGGCPYAKGASGNVATEDLVFMLENMGIQTGIDLKKVALASKSILDFLGRPSPSKNHHLLLGQK